MNGRIAVGCLCIVSALAASGFAAQGAFASLGTTGFTCKDQGGPTGGFTKAHCKPADAGTGNYAHVAIGESKRTEVDVRNLGTSGEKVPMHIEVTLAGMNFDMTAQGVASTGWMENNKDPGTGEHYGHGEVALKFTEVTNPICEVYGDTEGTTGEKGVLTTKPLIATTKGQGDFVKFEPTEGTLLGSLDIVNCKPSTEGLAILEGTHKVIGAIKAVPDGSTATFTHTATTEQATLRLDSALGPKVGLEGSLTVRARANAEDTYTGLSPTTVAT